MLFAVGWMLDDCVKHKMKPIVSIIYLLLNIIGLSVSVSVCLLLF